MGATPKIPTVTELPPWRSTTLLSFLVCCDCLLCVASSERHEPQRQPDSTYLRSCFRSTGQHTMKTCYIPSPFSPLNGAPRKALDLTTTGDTEPRVTGNSGLPLSNWPLVTAEPKQTQNYLSRQGSRTARLRVRRAERKRRLVRQSGPGWQRSLQGRERP